MILRRSLDRQRGWVAWRVQTHFRAEGGVLFLFGFITGYSWEPVKGVYFRLDRKGRLLETQFFPAMASQIGGAEMTVKAKRRLRLTLVSDTHELHRQSAISPSDLLIHAGDVSMCSRSLSAVRDFDAWLGELPCRHKLVTLGNHDEWHESGAYRLRNAKVLVNEAVRVEGLSIWGSPVTPLRSGAFAMPSLDDRRKLYRSIPEGTDILVTHVPPFGILDRAPGSNQHVGCMALLEAVQRVQPLIHVFGHVHSARGLEELDNTLYVNAALLVLGGNIAHPPVVLELPAL